MRELTGFHAVGGLLMAVTGAACCRNSKKKTIVQQGRLPVPQQCPVTCRIIDPCPLTCLLAYTCDFGAGYKRNNNRMNIPRLPLHMIVKLHAFCGLPQRVQRTSVACTPVLRSYLNKRTYR